MSSPEAKLRRVEALYTRWLNALRDAQAEGDVGRVDLLHPFVWQLRHAVDGTVSAEVALRDFGIVLGDRGRT